MAQQRPMSRPPVPPKLIVRAQNNDEDTFARITTQSLSLPTPDALGIRPADQRSELPTAKTVALDWNQIHSRLRQLNPVGVNTNRLPSGNFRVSLVLASGQSNTQHTFEAVANSESYAYSSVLQQAERWAQQH